jgi:aryl-alcohol dehydrogenase-like predicted oxidoreductase
VTIESGVSLARYTTIGTGGPARAFARAETLAELRGALVWARERELPIQALAIQWVLRNPRVGTILIGPKTPAEVEENVRMATMPLPEGIWAEVDERIGRG